MTSSIEVECFKVDDIIKQSNYFSLAHGQATIPPSNTFTLV